MNSTSRSAIDNAERSGYLKALREQARAVCVPLWWHGNDEKGSYRILHNGTASLVDTGSRRMAVTADHVLSKYLADKDRDPEIVCQLGSTTIELSDRVIDRDPTLDIATLEVSQVVVGPSGAGFHAPANWPTRPLAEGEVILCCGFPGKLREEGTAAAELPFQWFIGRATTVSPLNVSLFLDLENLQVPLSPSARLNRVLGGMSGGPVFRYVPGPIEHLEQVGIIYEYHESYELMLARPAQLLMANGAIARA